VTASNYTVFIVLPLRLIIPEYHFHVHALNLHASCIQPCSRLRLLLPSHLQGLQLFDEIFDGRYSKHLQAAGARIVDHYKSALIHHPKIGLKPLLRHIPAKEPNTGALCTRHLFESTARKLVADNPRVQFLYGASVTGLVFEEEGADKAAAADGDSAHRTVTGGCYLSLVALSMHAGRQGCPTAHT
jgi:hypothetical protein